jgi:hypothetical protein
LARELQQKEELVDRRDFIKSGAFGAAGLALSSAVPFLSPTAALAASRLQREKGKPFKFGVMADTQWKANLDGLNPGTCAVGVINLLNAEFIKHDVKFVVQVGDLVDKEDDATNGHPGLRTMPVRANAAAALYEAGIGFYPLRGNHEGSVTGANEFAKLYPQARGFGKNVFGADEFSSPFDSLDGLSYSFDYGNVRLVMLDQFVRADGTGYNNAVTTNVDSNIIDQQAWIDGRLSGRRKGSHAFTFAHKNLVGQNHTDTLFGPNPAANPTARNAYIGSMQANGVRYTLGGHDHMHHRSIVQSPDQAAAVKQLICSSNSYKFYIPTNPSNELTLEKAIAQELFTVGYYIFTVDGPRVTVEHFSSSHGQDYGDVDMTVTPTGATFYKREAWGYSLNGKEFVVAQGGSYTPVQDIFEGTAAAILGGNNQDSSTDAALRSLVKTVNTGWSHPSQKDDNLTSHVLTLWGLANSLGVWDQALSGLLPDANRTKQADTFALAMSYDGHAAHGIRFNNGRFGIATRDSHGHWVNSVDKNFGGTKSFVLGAWNPAYGLGTYGVDPSTRTAWAVVNYDGDFAVSKGL